MGKYPEGTHIRVRDEAFCDGAVGTVVTAANDTEYVARSNRIGKDAPLQAYYASDGSVKHCPEEYFELVDPVVTVSTKVIVPGHYGRLWVGIEEDNPHILVALADEDGAHHTSARQYFSADELESIGESFIRLADAMRDNPVEDY